MGRIDAGSKLKAGCGGCTPREKRSSAGAAASSWLPGPRWLRGLALSYEELSLGAGMDGTRFN